ncbi:UDP-sulfoquinovose synthase [Jezberella montanilacus]|jgi:UDP-sulfoquinovose synthase|uniref:UDP-sulfoquinovose synthase n=1 Tax=Jezberella montanilacus TaxID=323426 RepID=A0A2T0XNE4_9BURK|nr:NAD-dependent epimerase/dehydratase family protein [Jezberella montanilacus]PRZ00437.1 UDP-sulfoquinovose synthase [Jezberella montanilacus]
MNVLILGGDGYLGWPTAMRFASNGHQVTVVDNYLKRTLAKQNKSQALIPTPDLLERARIFQSLTNHQIDVIIEDCTNPTALNEIVQRCRPEVLIHYAEQPSGPYSMRGFEEAQVTFNNNIHTTFNVIWSVIKHAPDCHIIKLGTMGEYGTPNIDIEEGWIDIHHRGRTDKFLYPRQGATLYHTTKIMDTDLLWFYVRTYGLKVTDLMQGPVYGLITEESLLDDRLLTNFHYDDLFGTVLNRFIVQAVAGIPLTLYGSGGQTRGFLNIKDTLQCLELAAAQPVERGDLRILNQFTEQFSVRQLAEQVRTAARSSGYQTEIQTIKNPRKEMDSHYFNAAHQGLLDMGLKPHLLTTEIISEMISVIAKYQDRIDHSKVMPRFSYS